MIDVCSTIGEQCTDDVINHAHGMVDEEDAETIVGSYIARMTPRRKREPLPLSFCTNLVDFTFQQEISGLGGKIPSLLKVGFERA